MPSYVEIAKATLASLRTEAGGEDTEAEKATRLLQQRGWVAIRSEVLNRDIVVLCRDEAVRVPDKYAGCLSFVAGEFPLIAGASPARLRTLCSVKRLFGGVVIAGEDEADEDSAEGRR